MTEKSLNRPLSSSSLPTRKIQPQNTEINKMNTSLFVSKTSLRVEEKDEPAALSVEQVTDGHFSGMEKDSYNPDDDLEIVEAKGCWYKFKKSIRGIWMTRHTEDTTLDRELYIKTTLRELIVYCIFLIVLMVLTFGMINSTMYYYTKVMSDLFLESQISSKLTFKTISNIPEFWKFLRGPLLNGLYWNIWYNNKNITDPKHINFIYYENKLLGVPRIRQVRVRNDSCSIAKDFQKEIKACYSMYSPGIEEKDPFGYGNSTAWNFTSEEKLKGRSSRGQISDYEGGGYYIDLSKEKIGSMQIINELFKGLWIDRATRAVFIDFTVYNANINLFCVVKLLMEFPATGGSIPNWEFRTVKLLRYVAPKDYVIMSCEVIFMLFIIYYIIEEIIEIKNHKKQYFTCFWNWLDIIVILISLVCAAFNVYRNVVVSDKLKDLLKNEFIYPDFDFLSYWQQYFNYAIGFTLFFAWVKIFKYISFNKTMTQLSRTLGACAKDLLGFAVMFFIIFFAFAQLGYLIFGTQVKDFRQFQHSVFTLFRIILGDFDFHELENAHRILGPLFFLLYVFFVFFVLINMFLAIINDTYSDVKDKLAAQENEFEMADYFKERADKVLNKLNLKRDKIVGIQKAMGSADVNNDRQLDFDEWRAELKMRGYADSEIEALFAQYDTDGDRVLDEEEQKEMQHQLEGQKNQISRHLKASNRKEKVDFNGRPISSRSEAGSDLSAASTSTNRRPGPEKVMQEEYNVLCRRVDQLENSIGSIVNKIDAVLFKLDSMEKQKQARKEAMSNLLDKITKSEASNSTKKLKIEQLVREELEKYDQDMFSSQ